jgi:hypothetical protein
MEFLLELFHPQIEYAGSEENHAKVVLVNDKENNRTHKASIELGSPNSAKY